MTGNLTLSRSEMSYALFLHVSQYIGFILTEFTSFLLLWLIIKKSSSRMGSYKYLMMSFTLFSIVYAVIEIIAQPLMHAHGSCMLIFADSFLELERMLSSRLLALYCATFSTCVMLLVTHFVYRYFVVCRAQDMHHIQGWKLIKLYSFPIFCSILWYVLVVLTMSPSDAKTTYMRDVMLEEYKVDVEKIGYVGQLYHYHDKDGNLVMCWVDIVAAFVFCGIMVGFDFWAPGHFATTTSCNFLRFRNQLCKQVCIITMFICGWKTYWTMQGVRESMSEKTKELNKQLFRTLVLQTLIPLCTMFAPVGGLIMLPMFSIGVGRLANAPSFCAGFYPAVDAIIIIFMIRDFRNTVLCRTKKIKPKINSVVPTVLSAES